MRQEEAVMDGISFGEVSRSARGAPEGVERRAAAAAASAAAGAADAPTG
jgi:hypothetical protein